MSEQIKDQEQHSVNKIVSLLDFSKSVFVVFILIFSVWGFLWGVFAILGFFLTAPSPTIYFQEPKCAFGICIDFPKK